MTNTRTVDRALLTGIAWTAVLRWTTQVVSWAATLVVARLLVPGDYGVVAMATVSIGLVRMVEDFGLDALLVQDRTLEGARQARLAGLVVMTGVGLCLLFCLLAKPVSIMFGEPQVAWAIVALSTLLVTDALQVVPRALLQRDLAYRRLAVATFLQAAVTQVALVLAARAGWGFKSLVVNSISGAIFVTALLIYWKPYAIHWPTGLRNLAQPLLQGWRLLVSRMAYYAYTSADQAVIGRLLGKDALGAYSFSQTLSNTAVQEVGAVVSKVVPGVFSSVQHQRDELRRYFLMLTELVAYLTLPMAAGLAITADLVVPVVLGPHWDAVVAPLRLLCIFTAFSNAQLLVAHVMVWTGQFRAQMWCSIVSAVVMPIMFLVVVKHGVNAIALAWALIFPLTTLPAMIIGFRTINISWGNWGYSLLPALVSCTVMTIVVGVTREWLLTGRTPLVQLGVAVLVGAIAYAATMALLFGRRLIRMYHAVRALRSVSAAGATAEPASG